MMTHTGWLGSHPEAEELLSYLDRGLSVPAQEAVAGHLNECEYCQRELESIGAAVRTVSAALATVQVRPVSAARVERARLAVEKASRLAGRRRSAMRVWIPRLAAAGLLLAAGLLGAGPALAWFRSLMRDLAPAPVVEAPAASAETGSGEASAALQFDWSSTSFVAEFASVGTGSLSIMVQDSGQAAVSVSGGASRVGVQSRSTGVAFENSGSGSANYTLTLPRNVLSVTIQFAGVRTLRLAPGAGSRYRLEDLAAGVIKPEVIR